MPLGWLKGVWPRSRLVPCRRALAERAPDAQALSLQLLRLSRQTSPAQEEVTAACHALARRLKGEIITFRASDVVSLSTALYELGEKPRPILELLASHACRAMASYPIPLICTLMNNLARNGYLHRQLMDAAAVHLAERMSELNYVDISMCVYAFGELAYHPRNHFLEAAADRLKECHLEIGWPNISIILNSYARLSECNPMVFHFLSRALVHAPPEQFEAKHISVIMNAYARCAVRKSQTMHLLGDYLINRVDELNAQNIMNVVHAHARLTCYNVPLFQKLLSKVAADDLSNYKLFELGVLCHNLAKLKSGGTTCYSAMFGELARRPKEDWDPKALAQVLDAMRRRHMYSHDALLALLFHRFFETLEDYGVHPLTQASWCLVELDALDHAQDLPSPPDEVSEGFPKGRHAMQRVFERLQALDSNDTFTPTQRCHVQQLIRSYRYRYELDFGLLPQQVKSFCKAQFDVSSSVVSAVAKKVRRNLLGK